MDYSVVTVSFHDVGRPHYFDPGDLTLRAGDRVVAQTLRGLELGTVIAASKEMRAGKDLQPPPALVRQATPADLSQSYRNRLKAAEALRIARQKVALHRLEMKMLAAEYTLDGNRVVLYFAAEGRVDFRELVRDLAGSLRKRIELHQVGSRDRAKVTGGLGPCGRECCCSSWLRLFVPVSIKMTKEQGLSLNPTKISGSCGRLMCCLRYEYDTYRQLRQEMPRIGSEVRLPEGTARVLEVHLMRRTLKVEHPTLGIFEVPAGRALYESGGERCESCSSGTSCQPSEEEDDDVDFNESSRRKPSRRR